MRYGKGNSASVAVAALYFSWHVCCLCKQSCEQESHLQQPHHRMSQHLHELIYGPTPTRAELLTFLEHVRLKLKGRVLTPDQLYIIYAAWKRGALHVEESVTVRSQVDNLVQEVEVASRKPVHRYACLLVDCQVINGLFPRSSDELLS